MSGRSRTVSVNFFSDGDGSHYNHRQPTLNRSKTYDYFLYGDEPLAEDDVVIVRTYNDHTGPLRFAKVAKIVEGITLPNATRPIICRLPLERIEEQQKQFENVQLAKKLLKDAQQARSDADLFSEVSGQLSPEQQQFVADTLGFDFTPPAHNGKSLMSFEFFYNGQVIRILSPDEEAAQQAASTHFNVLPSLLTYKRL